MKPTFHQWCTAAAVAVIILGAMWILGQLYPAEATQQTFDSCSEVLTRTCEEEGWESVEVLEAEHIITAEQLKQLEEETAVDPTAPPTTAAEEETPTELEGEPNGNSNATLSAARRQRSIPPRIISSWRQGSVPNLRCRRSLHPHRRCRPAKANRPEVHHLVARAH